MEDFLRDILQTEHGEVKSKTGIFLRNHSCHWLVWILCLFWYLSEVILKSRPWETDNVCVVSARHYEITEDWFAEMVYLPLVEYYIVESITEKKFLAFILLFLYGTWFLFMWKHNTCRVQWWLLKFSSWDTETQMLILSKSWGCTLVLGTGNWLQKKKKSSTKPPIILILIFAVSSIAISNPVCFPWGCRAGCPPSSCTFHITFLASCLALCWALSLAHLADLCQAQSSWLKVEVSGHRVGCRNLQSRFERCSLGYHVHVCSQTRGWKSGCDYRVEVLFCSVVHIDCCLLPASRTSSFFSSYYYCYLRLEEIGWYHFKGKHQTDSLQLCHDPRAGFGFSHLYTSMFQDWLFQDLLKYYSAAQVAELGGYFSFLMKTQLLLFVSKWEPGRVPVCLMVVMVFFEMYICQMFNMGNGVKKPIKLLHNNFNNFR